MFLTYYVTLIFCLNNIGREGNTDFNDAEKAEGWYCRRKYNYNNLKSVENINKLIETIESEVFDESNQSSLIYKLKNKSVNN